MPGLLLEIGKDYGELEEEAINSAISPLAQIELDTALIKFYWMLAQLQIAVSAHNLESGIGGSSKVSKMKDALRQLQAAAQNLKSVAGEYDFEVALIKL